MRTTRPLHAAVLLLAGALWAGAAAEQVRPTFPVPGEEWAPRDYYCEKTRSAPVIDGLLVEDAWKQAVWTADFVDIQGSARLRPRLQTRVQMLWDDEYFYIGAVLEEPHLWGTLAQRDTVIYQDNDFEVFIDPDGDTHDYFELEINALGTQWDLFLASPYRDGGPALNAWDIPGLMTAVSLDGTLNDASDRDGEWSVEIAIPWRVLAEGARSQAPPAPGDTWRVNFSRVEWQLDVRGSRYIKKKDPATRNSLPEDNWVWSPQGLIAMHYPERWGFVHFRDGDGAKPIGAADPLEIAKQTLRLLYYKQKGYHSVNGAYATSLHELSEYPPAVARADWAAITARCRMTGDAGQFAIWREWKDGGRLYIDSSGRTWLDPGRGE